MKLRAIFALALLIACISGQAGSQIDPLAPDYLIDNQDPRRTTSLDRYIILDPRLDPLSIDPLVRPLDPEHTTMPLGLEIWSGQGRLAEADH